LAYCIQQTDDGSFIVVGYSGRGSLTEFDNRDICVVRTNSNGEIINSKTFGGNKGEWAGSIQKMNDGAFLVAGNTFSYGSGGEDIYLIKIQSNLNKMWEKTFGGTDNDGATNAFQASDGGIIIVGGTKSFGAGFFDIYLLKINIY